jgi:RNA polymerase sigma factor (sigma-70 family)
MSLPPFQLLLDRHGDDVLRYLRAAVGRQEAEDAWQETMIAALRAYPGLRDARNLRGWLLRIAHNTAIDLHRAAARRPLALAEPPEPAVEDAPASEPALWAAVRRLPAKQRAAVTLRFAGDMDYRAIGSLIDCSEVAARQNVRAGLAAVRREWAHARAT